MGFCLLLLYIKRKIGGIRDYNSFTESKLLLIILKFRENQKFRLAVIGLNILLAKLLP